MFFIAKRLLQIRVPETMTGAGTRASVGSWCRSRGLRNALVVTDTSILKLGIADKLLKSLKSANIESVIFDQVLPNLTLGMGASAAQVGKASQVDVVIALGGGSVIDCAKLASAAITNPGNPRKLLGKLKVKIDPLPIVAIPTTAGTGSEVTVGSVITDDQSHTKIIMVSPKIVPSLVILDAETMLGLPPAWTAGTAFDALTHACEAYISRIRDADGKTNAAEVVALIMKYLPVAVKDRSNIEARSALSQAAYKAGLAVNKCSLGYSHAIGNRLTDHYDVPHSVAVGMMLPHVLEYNLGVAEKRIADLAIRCGLGKPADGINVLAARFIQAVRDLAKEVNLPTQCEKLNFADYQAMITQAFQVANATYPVPRYMTRAEAAAMLDKVAPKKRTIVSNAQGGNMPKTIFITGASSGTGKPV